MIASGRCRGNNYPMFIRRIVSEYSCANIILLLSLFMIMTGATQRQQFEIKNQIYQKQHQNHKQQYRRLQEEVLAGYTSSYSLVDQVRLVFHFFFVSKK